MLATVATADSAKVQKKKYSGFIYSEAEPHAMYAIYKEMRKLCVLQYQKIILRKEDSHPNISIYYTSHENTLIPLDESHVSRLLATCVSVGSVTAGATQGVAPAIK